MNTVESLDTAYICIRTRSLKIKSVYKILPRFLPLVTSVITERNLEKKPKFRVRSNDHITLNSWDSESEICPEEHATGTAAVQRMRDEIAQRRIMTQPCFQDFDRNNCGYVRPNQFAQGLSYLGLESTEAERKVGDCL